MGALQIKGRCGNTPWRVMAAACVLCCSGAGLGPGDAVAQAPQPTAPQPVPAKPSVAPAAGLPARPPTAVAPGAKPAKPPAVKKDPKQREQARTKLLQRIRALRAQELAEVLKPDAPAVVKVVEIAAGYEDRLIVTRQEARQKRQELDKLLKEPKPDDAAILRVADDLIARRRKLEEVEAERTAALRKVLAPSQFAKVVVAWPRINRKIQETLYRALLETKGPGFDE